MPSTKQASYLLLLIFAKCILSESKYYISTTRATFLQALSNCRRLNMKMVTIDEEKKNSKLYNYYTKFQETYDWFWTSGIYQNNSITKEWYWLEGDKEFTYTDWRQNDPPFEPRYYGGDNCLRWGYYDPTIIGQGFWRSDNCDSMYRYICEETDSSSCENTYDGIQ